MRLAWAEKQRLMVELNITPEPVPAEKPNAGQLRPRSDRRSETLNT
jgi:hypothetical protein